MRKKFFKFVAQGWFMVNGFLDVAKIAPFSA